MNPPRASVTAQRLATALPLLPGLILLIWVPALRPLFVVLVAALAALAAHEFCRMAVAAGIEDSRRITIPFAALLAVCAGLFDAWGYGTHTALLPVLFAVVTLHLCLGPRTIAGLSASVFGVMYTGYCGSFCIALHGMHPYGPGLLTFLIAVIACSDTAAYFVGKTLGRHKLAPVISPNKTVEGALAALVGAAGCAAVLYLLKTGLQWNAYPAWPLYVYVLVAVLLSLVGQAGDLMESLMKRNANIKDSGILFPGHGGVLDRCDAMLFGGPALYWFVRFFEWMD